MKKYKYLPRYIYIAVATIVSIILLVTIKVMNLLPIKLYILCILLDLLALFLVLFILNRKNKILHILGVVLSAIFLIISFVGISYSIKTTKFLKSAFNNVTKEIVTYNLVTLNNSKIQNIKDLDDKKLGYLSSLDNDVIDMISSSPIYVEKDDLNDLYQELINKQVDAIFLDENDVEELGDIVDTSKLNIIKVFEILREINKKDEVNTLKPINIFLSGINNSKNKLYNKSRSNVNMLLTINPNTHKVLITSIPKELYIKIDEKDGEYDYLSHSCIYGLDVCSKAIGNLFSVNIDYSIKYNFSSVIKLIDFVGGIDIESDVEFTTNTNDINSKKVEIKKGTNHLNGKEALSYSREKYISDNHEHQVFSYQQQVIISTINKILSKDMIIKYDELLKEVESLYITDIPESLIKLLINEQLNSNPKWEFITQEVNGKEDYLKTITFKKKHYVLVPELDEIKYTKDKINNIIK